MTYGLYDYLTIAITSPLGIPAVLILVNQWNVKHRRYLAYLAALLCAVLLAFQAGAWALWGPTAFCLTLVALVSPVLSWGFFFAATPFRDGRLMFTLFTGMLLCSINEVLADTFTQRGTLAGIVARVVICAVQAVLLLFLCRKPFHRMLTTVGVNWGLLSAVPLLLLVCQLVLHIIPSSWQLIRPDTLSALVTCLTAVLIYVILYHLITATQQQHMAAQGYTLLQSQIHFLEQQTRQILASDNENRTFRHDVRHLVNLIQGCVAARDWDALDAILSRLGEDVDGLSARYMLRQYTGNVILDAVLSLAAQRCEEEGIDFVAQISLPPHLRVDIAELAVVASNSLDNAFNACAALGPDCGHPREVHIGSVLQGQQYLLTISNTCGGIVRFDSTTGFPLTPQRGHGFGTQSIAAFAEKYGAILNYSHKDGWFSLGILI